MTLSPERRIEDALQAAPLLKSDDVSVLALNSHLRRLRDPVTGGPRYYAGDCPVFDPDATPPHTLLAAGYEETARLYDAFRRVTKWETDESATIRNEQLEHESDHAAAIRAVGIPRDDTAKVYWGVTVGIQEGQQGGGPVIQPFVTPHNFAMTALGLAVVFMNPLEPSSHDKQSGSALRIHGPPLAYRVLEHTAQFPEHPYPLPRSLPEFAGAGVLEQERPYYAGTRDEFTDADRRAFEDFLQQATSLVRP